VYSADSVYTCDDWYTNGDFCCFDCRQGLRRPVNFWEAVTAEVGLYADQKDKERRAKSVTKSWYLEWYLAVMSTTGFPSSSYVHPSAALTYPLCMHVDLVSQAPVSGYFPSQPSIPLHTTVSSRNATVLLSD